MSQNKHHTYRDNNFDDGYITDSETNNIKLHQACIKENRHTIEHIAKAKPWLINTRDDEGNTPFHIASSKLDMPTVKLFLELGGNPFLENDSKLTPAMIIYKMSQSAKAAKIKVDFCEIYTVFNNHFSRKHLNLEEIMVKNTGPQKNETINIMDALFYGDITFKEAQEKYKTDMSNKQQTANYTHKYKKAEPEYTRGRSLYKQDDIQRTRYRNSSPQRIARDIAK